MKEDKPCCQKDQEKWQEIRILKLSVHRRHQKGCLHFCRIKCNKTHLSKQSGRIWPSQRILKAWPNNNIEKSRRPFTVLLQWFKQTWCCWILSFIARNYGETWYDKQTRIHIQCWWVQLSAQQYTNKRSVCWNGSKVAYSQTCHHPGLQNAVDISILPIGIFKGKKYRIEFADGFSGSSLVTMIFNTFQTLYKFSNENMSNYDRSDTDDSISTTKNSKNEETE